MGNINKIEFLRRAQKDYKLVFNWISTDETEKGYLTYQEKKYWLN